ncbi:MAG: glucosaminidase domain-containing protein [Smithella sp.]
MEEKRLWKILFGIALALAIIIIIVYPPEVAFASELTDPATPCGLTAEDYDELLEGKGLQGIGEALEVGEKITGINGLFVASICALESGWGTSHAATELNNIGGIQYQGENVTFKSWDECIYTMFDFLDRMYIREGLNTIDEIGPVYCQSPESTWAEDVTSIMRGFTDEQDVPAERVG